MSAPYLPELGVVRRGPSPGALPHVLHLVHRLPYPPDKGDRIHSFHLLRYLSTRATVHLACLADEPVPVESVVALERYCRRVAVVRLRRTRWLRAVASLTSGASVTEGAFWSPRLANILRGWSRETQFDAVLACSSSMVPYLKMPEWRSLPLIADLVDVDSQKWFDYAAMAGPLRRWLYGLEGRRLRHLEKILPTWTQSVLLSTTAEARIYERFAGPDTATVMNNGVDLDYFAPGGSVSVSPNPGEIPPEAEEPSCVFVGALDYLPNIDAACWFCSEVWPRIRDRRRNSKLYLVGRKPAPAVKRLADVPGVEVVGTVTDVRPWLSRATVVVAPLRIARGVQNKVLEALAMAKAVVVASTCIGGLGARPGEELLSAATPQEWSEKVLALFDDPAWRCRLGRAGRLYVEERHSWDRCLTPLGDTLARLRVATRKDGAVP